MNYLDERQAIIETCLWLEETGMVIGTFGNVSIRLADGNIMLTPSKVAYQDLRPEDLVIVDLEGNKIQGERNATSEMHVHRLIYVNRPDIGAVIHYHPVYGSAMCASNEGIPAIFEELSQVIGGSVPITKSYINAGSHLELAKEAATALGEKNAVLIRNHAPVCGGRDLEEAKTACLVVEKAAKCYMALKAGFPDFTVIPDELVASERHRYLHTYGHEL